MLCIFSGSMVMVYVAQLNLLNGLCDTSGLRNVNYIGILAYSIEFDLFMDEIVAEWAHLAFVCLPIFGCTEVV